MSATVTAASPVVVLEFLWDEVGVVVEDLLGVHAQTVRLADAHRSDVVEWALAREDAAAVKLLAGALPAMGKPHGTVRRVAVLRTVAEGVADRIRRMHDASDGCVSAADNGSTYRERLADLARRIEDALYAD